MPGGDLIQQVEALLRALGSAGLEATDPVDAMGLWRMLRPPVDPTGGGGRRGRRRLGERLGLVTPASAGPLVLETGWQALVAPSETELVDTDARMLINTEPGTREPAQTRTDPDPDTTARTVGLHHAA